MNFFCHFYWINNQDCKNYYQGINNLKMSFDKKTDTTQILNQNQGFNKMRQLNDFTLDSNR